MGEHLCPICGKHTFPEYDSYEICPICGWEDDGLQYKRPDYAGGANPLSQNEYRKQWQERQAKSKGDAQNADDTAKL